MWLRFFLVTFFPCKVYAVIGRSPKRRKQMLNPLAVRIIVLVSGERLPVLVSRATGKPLFEPTVYSVSELRATNKAANTIEHALRSVMLLLLFLDLRGIDLAQRMREGRVLDVGEIDALSALCREPTGGVLLAAAGTWQQSSQRVAHAALEKVRSSPKRHSTKQVCSATVANRIRAIRDYLGWLVNGYLSRQGGLVTLEAAWMRCRITLDAKVPGKRNRDCIGQREGLAPDVLRRLLTVASPDAAENPWPSRHAKVRNYLLIRWLSDLGLRRGELLNVKISDIDFRAEQVTIARRSDDPGDPRRHQPLVKTRDRIIPLSAQLCSLTLSYVTNIRSQLRGARKHEFLIVADRSGAPMSLSAMNDVFEGLRKAFPGEFPNLQPHVLRHTWNDKFSEAMDKAGVTPDDEQQMRAFLMGWSPTSQTAHTYTRRHTRRKARAVSLAMQTAQFEGGRE